MSPAAAPALTFCPARTGLHHGLIAEVTRGSGASGVISIKQIDMSLYSLCFAWKSRASEKQEGQENALVGFIIGLTSVTKQLITENN